MAHLLQFCSQSSHGSARSQTSMHRHATHYSTLFYLATKHQSTTPIATALKSDQGPVLQRIGKTCHSIRTISHPALTIKPTALSGLIALLSSYAGHSMRPGLGRKLLHTSTACGGAERLAPLERLDMVLREAIQSCPPLRSAPSISSLQTCGIKPMRAHKRVHSVVSEPQLVLAPTCPEDTGHGVPDPVCKVLHS